MANCEYCGKELQVSRNGPKPKHCSQRCRYLLRSRGRGVQTRRCLYCGNVIPPDVDAGKKHCSSDCRQEYHKQRRAGEERDRRIHDKVCVRCGSAFKAERQEQKYCGYECAGEDRKTWCTCETCGVQFRKKSPACDGRYCSKTCGGIGRSHDAKKRRLVRMLKQYAYDKQYRPWKVGLATLIGYCAWCGLVYKQNDTRQQCCSTNCSSRLHYWNNIEQYRFYYKRKLPLYVNCGQCGRKVQRPYYWKGKCQTCVEENTRAFQKRRKHKRKAKEANGENISPKAIYERDGYRCQHCGYKTRPDWGGNHDRHPSVDHIVPISAGGEHNWQNLQCLCRKCNSIKSNNKVPDQMCLELQLVGM